MGTPPSESSRREHRPGARSSADDPRLGQAPAADTMEQPSRGRSIAPVADPRRDGRRDRRVRALRRPCAAPLPGTRPAPRELDPVDQPALAELGLLHVSSEAGRPAQTVAWLAMSKRVAAYAASELGGDPSAGAIASEIVAQPVAGADVVDIAATTRRPATAAAVANAVADGVRAARAADLRPTHRPPRRAAPCGARRIWPRLAAPPRRRFSSFRTSRRLRANGDLVDPRAPEGDGADVSSWPNRRWSWRVPRSSGSSWGCSLRLRSSGVLPGCAARVSSAGSFAAPVIATIESAESRRWRERGRRPPSRDAEPPAPPLRRSRSGR